MLQAAFQIGRSQQRQRPYNHQHRQGLSQREAHHPVDGQVREQHGCNRQHCLHWTHPQLPADRHPVKAWCSSSRNAHDQGRSVEVTAARKRAAAIPFSWSVRAAAAPTMRHQLNSTQLIMHDQKPPGGPTACMKARAAVLPPKVQLTSTARMTRSRASKCPACPCLEKCGGMRSTLGVAHPGLAPVPSHLLHWL